MLRTNLSTRPFYNARAVRFGIGLAVVLIAAFTSFNGLQVMSLNARNGEFVSRAEQSEAQSAQYRERALAITQAMDKVEVTAIQEAAREANSLIEQRAFSWTELFNRFETTLPADVRISAVEPQIDRDGRLLLVITAISRRVEDLNAFIEQLETSGGLRDVLPRDEATQEDGTTRSVIQGYYNVNLVAPEATTSPGASDSSRPMQNGSPSAANATPPSPREDGR